MKVLQICPLWFPITPDAPGGIETLLATLVASLERLGCECTLLATQGSRGCRALRPVLPEGLVELMRTGSAAEYVCYEQEQLQLALSLAPEFDIVHSHVGPGAFILSGIHTLCGRTLHTIHTPVYHDLAWYASRHPEIWFSTVSAFQARRLRSSSERCRVVPNGIDMASFRTGVPERDRLAFVGRIEHSKGVDIAVQIANDLGMRLTIAGPIIDGQYFEDKISPHLNERIRYVGTVDHSTKVALYGSSACALLPFRGDESFGLVSIEAMACGTPVVALARGALPEIVDPGWTGYLATSEAELPELVRRAMQLDRNRIRARANARFSIDAVAASYIALYDLMLSTSEH